MAEIDSLSIRIETDAKQAKSGIDALEGSLSKLRNTLKSGIGLDAVVTSLESLDRAAGNINGTKVAAIQSMATAIGKLQKLDATQMVGVGKAIEDIALASSYLSSNGLAALQALAAAAPSLSALGKVTVSANLATGIFDLSVALEALQQSMGTTGGANLTSLVTNMMALNSLQGLTIPANLGRTITSIANATNALNGITNFDVFQRFADAIQPLQSLQDVGNLGTFLNALNRIPRLMQRLNATVLLNFEQALQRIAAALQPIATLSTQGAAGINQLITMMNQVIRLGGRIGNQTNRSASNFLRNSLILRVVTRYMNTATTLVSDWLKNTNSYIEDLNLFTASMGKYAAEAQNYAEKVSDVMGLDPAQWMRNQGVFMTLAEGFGVASDRAYIMSKNLTQLGYDLSSFFNISVEDAMQKLQSGLSGELEPLRRLGYDLSQARLKAVALELGITKSFNAMTQAEKSQLRYHAIMNQVTKAQGDMARTLEAPANQLRILQAQVTQAARALGSVFIPLLNATLPYVIALAQAVRRLAESIASIFGFKLPEVDYSGITNVAGAADDAEDALSGANGAAQKLNETLAGFDELNIIASESGGGGGSGSGASSGGDGFDFDLTEYDFLGDALSDKLDAVKKKLDPIFDGIIHNLDTIVLTAAAVTTAFRLWPVNLGDTAGLLRNIAAIAAVVSISAVLKWKFTKDFLSEDGDFGDILNQVLTTGIASAITGVTVTRMATGLGADAAAAQRYGFIASGLVIGLHATLGVIANAQDVRNDGIDAKNVWQGLLDTLEIALGTALIVGGVTGSLTVGLMGAGIAAGVSVAGIAITLGIAQAMWASDQAKAIKWGDLTLDGSDVSTFVSAKYFKNLDVTGTINSIKLVISENRTAEDALDSSRLGFDVPLNLLRLGLNDEATYSDLLTSLWGSDTTSGSPSADSLIGRLKAAIESDTEVIKVGVGLDLISAGSDGTKTLSLFQSIDQTTYGLIETEGAKLADYYRQGMLGELKDTEQDTVYQISSWFSRISQAVVDGQIMASMDLMMSVSLKDLSKQTLSDVVQEFESQVSAIRDAYKDQIYAQLASYGSKVKTAEANYNLMNAPGSGYTPEQIAAAKQQWDKAAEEYASYSAGAAQLIADKTEAQVGPYRQMLIDEMLKIFRADKIAEDVFSDSWSIEAIIAEALRNGGDESGIAFEINSLVYDALANSLSRDDFNALLENMNVFDASLMGYNFASLLSPELQAGLLEAITQAVNGDEEQAKAIAKALGLAIPGDVSEGITEGQDVIENGIENAMSGAAATADTSQSASEYASRWVADVSRKLSGIKISMNASGGILGKIKSYFGYASGGFPKTGETFVANEAGPELIGRIGNRTAVANTNQIVQGISYGVSSANEEQNRLLREQNTLLTQLLNKELKAEITPSVALGKVNARSAQLYQKAYG